MPQDTLVVQPTGIDALDDILNGGIPQGHAILLAGNSGSGKTVLSLSNGCSAALPDSMSPACT